jgi:hypothetical protein
MADVKRTERRGRGRPATGQAPRISIRLAPAEQAAMDAARTPGESPSQFVRAAIKREIAARKP